MTRGIDADAPRQQILIAPRLILLGILNLGSSGAVQLCVLLGSYHLHHGEPELAWSFCGRPLRLAQALDLYRLPTAGTKGLSSQEIGVRKRCWWAVHEIETSCSMV